MLAIIDYQAGNQTSVGRALDYLKIPFVISADPKLLACAEGIIFPGVGSAPQAMQQIEKTGIAEVLRQAIKQEVPILGICLGCQILLEGSDEGPTKTLGILPGKCKRFEATLTEEDGSPINIPHMGWNSIIKKGQTSLLNGIDEKAEFYFVHSYYTDPPKELWLATTFYGREFCSIYGRDGLWAVQFHPEKSGTPGLKLLANFYEWCKIHHKQN